jgi:hypothetical protein
MFIGNPDADCKLSFPLQEQIDWLSREGKLPDTRSSAIIRWIHREFFKDMPPGFRHLEGVEVVPGEWRAEPPEVAVGQHIRRRFTGCRAMCSTASTPLLWQPGPSQQRYRAPVLSSESP